MNKNGINSRVSVLEEQYKIFYTRFNEEVGEIRDSINDLKTVVVGDGKSNIGVVNEIRETKKSIAIWTGIIVIVATIAAQVVIPKILEML